MAILYRILPFPLRKKRKLKNIFYLLICTKRNRKNKPEINEISHLRAKWDQNGQERHGIGIEGVWEGDASLGTTF